MLHQHSPHAVLLRCASHASALYDTQHTHLFSALSSAMRPDTDLVATAAVLATWRRRARAAGVALLRATWRPRTPTPAPPLLLVVAADACILPPGAE
jgi:hypothetical protein